MRALVRLDLRSASSVSGCKQMALLLNRTLTFSVATDSDNTEFLASRSNSLSNSAVLIDSAEFVRDLAAGANVLVDPGTITNVLAIAVEAVGSVNLRLGAPTATPIPIVPLDSASTAVARLWLETSGTATIYIENPGTVSIRARVFLYGT